VDGLLSASKNLRFTKYGDRLQQFMGPDGADEFMDQLQQAQELGSHGMKARKIAKIVSGLLAGSAATSLGVELMR
jgi:hypothetical protein